MFRASFFVLLRTITSLSISQIFFRIYYVIKRRTLVLSGVKPLKLKNKLKNYQSKIKFHNVFDRYYYGDFENLINLKFTFLNKEIIFNKEIDWNKKSMNEGTRLFKLNLHYQTYLVDIALDYRKKKSSSKISFILKIIKSWVNQNNYFDKESFRCSWNSYCVSNRLINYIKVISIIDSDINYRDKKFVVNVIKQHSNFLRNNFEYDIRGNHLLENHIAYLFSQIFFDNKKQFRFYLKKTFKLLNKQILDDGAHYELSTMYHGIIFCKLIELVNYANLNCFLNKIELNKFKKTLTKMLNWAYEIQLNDNIPLLNDSSKKLTHNFNFLNKHFKKVFGHSVIIDKTYSLKSSGFRKFNTKVYEILIDVGQIGAKEMPGHSHADTFNTIIYDKKGPLFIDPGVSTYNNNFSRQNERSTRYHNTVSLESFNSSEIWNSFRVGKQCDVDIIYESNNYFHAVHNGYSLFGSKIDRKWFINDNSLIIRDSIINPNKNKFLQNWILTPNRKFEIINKKIFIDGVEISFESKSFFIEYETINIPIDFNLKQKTHRISICFKDNIKTKLKFL